MSPNDFNRRDFHRLTLSALGGMFAGAAVGCNSGEDAPPPAPSQSTPSTEAGRAPPPTGETTEVADADLPVILQEPHVCRGLNTCKGKGKGGENACAGQGACATAAEHTCHGQNECKGQGGCGTTPGQNECKGKGDCSVPLMDSIWDDARTAFENAMKEQDREFGEAPAA